MAEFTLTRIWKLVTLELVLPVRDMMAYCLKTIELHNTVQYSDEVTLP